MTMVRNMVFADESIQDDKTEAIVNHLHEIGFLDKDKGWQENDGWGDELVYYPSSVNFFNYVTVKEMGEFAGYGKIPDPEKDDPELYEIFVTHTMSLYGNNAVEISGGDIYEDCPKLIEELEQVTGDTYRFKSEWT